MAAPTPLAAIELAMATDKDMIDYAISWFDRMIQEESKAVEEYGKFEALVEEASGRFSSNPVLAQLLKDTAIIVGSITTDELKHHAMFIRARQEYEGVR